jgi:hypothetical protein
MNMKIKKEHIKKAGKWAKKNAGPIAVEILRWWLNKKFPVTKMPKGFKSMKPAAVASIALILLASCATQPTILDQGCSTAQLQNARICRYSRPGEAGVYGAS